MFDLITSLDNLFNAWAEFRLGKRTRADVQEFEYHLEDNIFELHQELIDGTYTHGPYKQFRITDPKPRQISKALVRDRLLHHALYRILYPLFDRGFIFDSYSCRVGKGTHKAFARLEQLCNKVSKNNTAQCWALKCDIRKFFDSVDHSVLGSLLEAKIKDEKLLTLLKGIVGSFQKTPGKGMPLGNLTSQLFANVYLDPLDKFVKHTLEARYYLRYADDFIFLGGSTDELMGFLIEINRFLKHNLKLELHPNKISLRKLSWGIDFVGYVAYPHHSLPRRKTLKRITNRLKKTTTQEPDKVYTSLQSYLGYLKHTDSYKSSLRLREIAKGVVNS
jgi:retron-type reverse transcriptase